LTIITQAKRKGYSFFAIQFYGECWSGPDSENTYAKHGSSSRCTRKAPLVGKQRANYVYMLTTGLNNKYGLYEILNPGLGTEWQRLECNHRFCKKKKKRTPDGRLTPLKFCGRKQKSLRLVSQSALLVGNGQTCFISYPPTYIDIFPCHKTHKALTFSFLPFDLLLLLPQSPRHFTDVDRHLNVSCFSNSLIFMRVLYQLPAQRSI